MSYADEFEQQWKGISNYLESEMIKNGCVDVAEIQKLLDNEKKRWKLPGQYQYAWLEKLRSEQPQIADEFESALSEIGLTKEQTEPIPSSSPLTAGSVAGGAAVGFLVTRLLDLAWIFSAVGTIGLGFVGGMAGKAISDSKREERISAERDVYMKQIQNAGERLAEIIKKTE